MILPFPLGWTSYTCSVIPWWQEERGFGITSSVGTQAFEQQANNLLVVELTASDGPSVYRVAILMQNIILLANKQFTEMSLCPLVCSLLCFTAMAPYHLDPTGTGQSRAVSSLPGLHCGSCMWVTSVLGPDLIPGVNHRGSLTIPTESWHTGHGAHRDVVWSGGSWSGVDTCPCHGFHQAFISVAVACRLEWDLSAL